MSSPAPGPGIGERFVLGFKGQRVPEWLRAFERRFGLGGVILFDYDVGARRYGNNVVSPEQVRALCRELAALPSRPLVFVDQEGGKVRRLKEPLGFCPLPGAAEFARLPQEQREALARASFRELRALGIHYNLAPVVDLNSNPANPDIGAHGRSYSEHPGVVRENVELLDRAAREAGLGLCLKHYPGIGGARTNSHDELTDLTDSLSDTQLALFWDWGGKIAGAAILVSHGLVRAWDASRPVSVSATALASLRERVPGALLISDDMQMQGLRRILTLEEACRAALRTELDLMLIGNNLLDEQEAMAGLAEHLEPLVRDDPHIAARHAASLDRIRDRKRRFGPEAAGPGGAQQREGD
jgi:beta-N-acetylhexosaminidase